MNLKIQIIDQTLVVDTLIEEMWLKDRLARLHRNLTIAPTVERRKQLQRAINRAQADLLALTLARDYPPTPPGEFEAWFDKLSRANPHP